MNKAILKGTQMFDKHRAKVENAYNKAKSVYSVYNDLSNPTSKGIQYLRDNAGSVHYGLSMLTPFKRLHSYLYGPNYNADPGLIEKVIQTGAKLGYGMKKKPTRRKPKASKRKK